VAAYRISPLTQLSGNDFRKYFTTPFRSVYNFCAALIAQDFFRRQFGEVSADDAATLAEIYRNNSASVVGGGQAVTIWDELSNAV